VARRSPATPFRCTIGTGRERIGFVFQAFGAPPPHHDTTRAFRCPGRNHGVSRDLLNGATG